MELLFLFVIFFTFYICSMEDKELKKKIAYAIYMLRTQNRDIKITKQDIAYEVGVSSKYIYELENGKKMPSLFVVEGIARAFGLKLSEFCKIIEEQ